MAQPAEYPHTSGPPKKDIELLLLVAGASCSGKTTLINDFRESDEPSCMPTDLHSGRAADFEFHDAIDWIWPWLPTLNRPKVCLHYDIFLPLTFHMPGFEADSALSLLTRARYVAALTLWESPQLLALRNRVRRKRLWHGSLRSRSYREFRANYARYKARRRRRSIMQSWLDDPLALWALYSRWFYFCEAAGVDDHWVAQTAAHGPVFTYLRNGRPEVPLWPVSEYG